MIRPLPLMTLATVLASAALPSKVPAQIVVIDDVIILTTQRLTQQQERLVNQHLELPGGAERLPRPGADTPRLGEDVAVTAPAADLLSGGGQARQFRAAGRLQLPPLGTLERVPVPLYGPLELPAERDDGPADGLTVDAAIERLLAANYDLNVKSQDIPKARAAILTAGLRNNPLVFFSASQIPYQRFSEQRPGATNYDLTIIQPIDVSGQRVNRVLVAKRAENVAEAQYQNAVRLALDNLYTAYLDVLENREAVRAAQTGVNGLEEVLKTTRELVRQGQRPQADLTAVLMQQSSARDALQRMETALANARRNLATLLAVPPEQAGILRLRASLRLSAPPPPSADALVELALQVRPDLASYRLGVERARADVQLARARSFGNVYLFATPYTATDFSPQGKQSANGFGLGLLLSAPVFNRNQGNIARAGINVTQTQIDLDGLTRQAVSEVRDAAAEYASSHAIVERYDRQLLADARRLLDEKSRLYAKGQISLGAFLEARKDYNDVIREYLDALVRQRRDAFALNTAVGQRILP